MNLIDRVLTIVVTATITSAIWIVGGGSLIEMADSKSQLASTRPAEAAPSPAPAATTTDGAQDKVDEPGAKDSGPDAAAITAPVDNLHTEAASQPQKTETRSLMIPVLNVRPAELSDTFNRQNTEGSPLHEALDIMAPDGTSVVAAAPGTIEKLFASKSGGKTIYVRSKDGRTIHYYAHLGNYSEGLKEGQRVRRGQRLGTVGSTGNASVKAPHLHFAILRTTKDAQWWEPANAINPFPLLTKR